MLLDASRAFLEHHQQRIREEHRGGDSGRLIVGSLTSMTDTLIRNLYRSVSADMRTGGAVLHPDRPGRLRPRRSSTPAPIST